MPTGGFRFGDFTLDTGERLVLRGGERLDLSTRYIDALALLLAERGRLVTKSRFMDEVWQGVPVTDEALTQCIRTLRRQLGDDAARPRFIETVPKHGYRFIAEAERFEARTSDGAGAAMPTALQVVRVAGLTALGGACSGVGGGLFYGLAVSSSEPPGALGALSMMAVLLAVNVLVGLLAGFGVGAGIAAARLVPSEKWQWSTLGGMIGGLLTGGAAKLLGLDAFAMLVGHSPAGMTGAPEGALLGAALGLAASIAASRKLGWAASVAVGALAGGGAGLLVPLLGGHLLGGSLNLLAHSVPDARFSLDAIGGLLGEASFGRASEVLTATLEGGLFGGCVGAALAVVRIRGDVRPFRAVLA